MMASPDSSRTDVPKDLVRIGEGRVNIGTQADLIDRIIADAKAGRGGTVFTLNLDHLVKLRSDAGFRTAYDAATYVSADGSPVVKIARRQGAPVDLVTGADLVVPLCRAAAAAGVSIHLFGTSDAIRDEAAAKLVADIPGLVIAGSESPPRGFDPEGEAAKAAAGRIEASGAGICFVALGAPKQELFAHAATRQPGGVTYVCIGAALDFISGRSKRAPVLFRRTGTEWVWRFIQEPRRLGMRYARSMAYYLGYLIKGPEKPRDGRG
ncbi:WecB/TagA/CpsF family glycosyltransferase [Kaistia granuli]|uniref:WecB/TagA/CpsF family glycosyltransferase n=1 Tax=Kaistia granuli TaxID=363259 RepID=UPI00035CB150|nr:WecB/TagA/CpsF family glycosyltransferase [Kaistia granuli]